MVKRRLFPIDNQTGINSKRKNKNMKNMKHLLIAAMLTLCSVSADAALTLDYNLLFENHAAPSAVDFPYIGVLDDGATYGRNLLIAASPSLFAAATNSSYVAVSAKEDPGFSGNLLLGVQSGDEIQFQTDNSFTPTTTFDGSTWDFKGSALTNAILDETDPIWVAASNGVPYLDSIQTFTGFNTFDGMVDLNTDAVAGTDAVNYQTMETYVNYTRPCLKLELRRDSGAFMRAHEVEIKASTNNFVDLVYYVKTWTTTRVYDVTGDLTYPTADDDSYLLYFNDPQQGGTRGGIDWETSAIHTSIESQLVNSDSRTDVMYFFPSRDCEYPADRWMSQTNANLVWSYVVWDLAGPETNTLVANEEIWNMLEPVNWANTPTTP